VLLLDMIEVHPPMEKYKYDTWRILLVKCYIDNSMRLQSCIRNVNTLHKGVPKDNFYESSCAFRHNLQTRHSLIS
jgi:hypothetical protein